MRPRILAVATLRRRAVMVFAVAGATLMLLGPLEVMASDEGTGEPTSTTTTIETSTTTTGATTTTTTESSTTTTIPGSSTTTTDDGLLPPPPIVFPLVGAASLKDTFGEARDDGERVHLGTDIIAKRGTPVVAVATGVVERMGENDTAGQFVVVRHNAGWRSAYVHLNNDSPGTDNGLTVGYGPGVEVGARVKPGTLLGYVGDSGNAEETTPHLHFELHQPDGLKINPFESLVAARRIREATALPTVDYGQVVADGAELVAHLDTLTGFNADIAAVDDHVYLGTWGNAARCPGTGVRVVDVSNPAEPLAVTSFADSTEFPDTSAASIWIGDVDTPLFAGRIGVVGIRRCQAAATPENHFGFVGIAIYDLADPAAPSLLSVASSGFMSGGVEDLDVSVDEGRVLIAATVPDSHRDTAGLLGALRIIDITDPASPAPLADWQPATVPVSTSSIPVGADMSLTGTVSGVVWVDHETIAIGRESGSALIIDVSDPTAPAQTSRVETDAFVETAVSSRPIGTQDGHLVLNQSPALVPGAGSLGRQLIVGLGPDGASSPLGAITFDSGPWAEPEADDTAPEGFFYPGGTTGFGRDGIVVAWMSGGVRVIDLSDPASPTETAHLVPAPVFDPQRWWIAPNGTDRFAMVWDVAESEGYYYASDHNSGIWVFTLPPPPTNDDGPVLPD